MNSFIKLLTWKGESTIPYKPYNQSVKGLVGHFRTIHRKWVWINPSDEFAFVNKQRAADVPVHKGNPSASPTTERLRGLGRGFAGEQRRGTDNRAAPFVRKCASILTEI